MKKFIKIYGERNTNTNYLNEIISLNLNCQLVPGSLPEIQSTLTEAILKLKKRFPENEILLDFYFALSYSQNLGWKHSKLLPHKITSTNKAYNNDISFITLTKNPYSWLLSLHQRPYHNYSKRTDFLNFLSSEWETVRRDKCQKKLKNPIELWNIKNSSYLKLAPQTCLNLTTESIIQNPEAVITSISQKFNIEKLNKTFINFEKSTKDKNKDFSYYQNYYQNELWKEKLCKDSINYINKHIDKDLMQTFGYEIIE